MLKFSKTLLLAVLLMCVAVLPVQAAVKVATVGAQDSSGNYAIEVDSDHFTTFNGGVYSKYELVTTSDTITAAESGKTFIVEGVVGSRPTLILPDADVGLEFTFVQGDVTCVAAVCAGMYIDPQSTDYIVSVNGTTALQDAGDKINNTNGYTADSIRLICGQDLYWYATDTRGTWADAGTDGE